MHNSKRALFEFLPLPWLRTYRELKNWVFSTGKWAAPSNSAFPLATIFRKLGYGAGELRHPGERDGVGRSDRS